MKQLEAAMKHFREMVSSSWLFGFWGLMHDFTLAGGSREFQFRGSEQELFGIGIRISGWRPFNWTRTIWLTYDDSNPDQARKIAELHRQLTRRGIRIEKVAEEPVEQPVEYLALPYYCDSQDLVRESGRLQGYQGQPSISPQTIDMLLRVGQEVVDRFRLAKPKPEGDPVKRIIAAASEIFGFKVEPEPKPEPFNWVKLLADVFVVAQPVIKEAISTATKKAATKATTKPAAKVVAEEDEDGIDADLRDRMAAASDMTEMEEIMAGWREKKRETAKS